MLEGSFLPLGDGHRLFVRNWGSGAPLLLLPGWGMTSDSWGGVMSILADQGLRTVSYDRRGHGRSSDPGAVDYDMLADDLDRVVEALGLEGATIVAHSGAAGEAVSYASRYGVSRIAGLVLVGAVGPCMMRRENNPDGIPADLIDLALEQIRDDLPAWIEGNALPFAPTASRRALDWVADMLLTCSRKILVDFQRAIMTADFRREYRSLRLAVTLIHGDQDATAPLDLTARQIAKLVSGADLIVYEGGAHGLMLTHPRELARDIKAHMMKR